MKKLAIISTYNESCGNASYTEVLRKEFSKYYEVDILPLQLDILSSNASNIKKIANKHIDEISQAVKNYDYVNIQFEAGLYGNTKNDILRRVKKIIKASNNAIAKIIRTKFTVWAGTVPSPSQRSKTNCASNISGSEIK